jgi:hypothetical protein
MRRRRDDRRQLASHYTYTVLDIEHNLTERTLAALDVVGPGARRHAARRGAAALGAALARAVPAPRYADDKLVGGGQPPQSNDVISHATPRRCSAAHLHAIPNDSRTSAAGDLADHLGDRCRRELAIAKSYLSLAAKLPADRGHGEQPARPTPTPSLALRQLFRLGRK